MMNSLTSIGILLVAISFFVIAIVLITARLTSRNQQLRDTEDSPIPVNLASINDGVILARVGGQVVYINDAVSDWFQINGSEPDLWVLSQKVTPAEAFLELFASEGQATFSVNGRTVQATSHRIAVGDEAQFIVVLREEAPLPTLERTERGSAKALQVVSEIAQAINAPLELDATLTATLDGVARLVPFDTAQITLWNKETETLRPVMRVGEPQYVEVTHALREVYRPGEGYTGWVGQNRRALLVEDVTTEQEVERAPRPTDPLVGSYMGVPLTVRNRFIGTLEVMATQPNHFDREDLAVLNLIAEQAAIAIENARRYSTQAERVAELSGLQKIAEAISVLQDPYQLFDQLSARIAELMDTEIAGVLLWEREHQRLIPQRPVHGVPDNLSVRFYIPLERGSPARSVWEEVSFWYSNNVMADHLVQELELTHLAEMAGMRTTAMAAMTVGDEKIGALQVANRRSGNPFTLEDLRLLQIYANQASIVVESARLYSMEQSRVAELQGLQQISQAISAFSDPEELYGQLTTRIAELVGVDMCGILLYDPVEEQLTARQPFYGVRPDVAEKYTIPINKRGLPQEVWRDAELFVSNEATSDNAIDDLEMRDVVRDAAMQTLMLAPLSAGGRRFGMLHVANKTDRTDFDEDDRRLVTIFAAQAAALIDNARLYQDTDATLQRRASELRSVSRISRELNTTLELDRILEVIASEAQQAEGADFGNVVMFEWNEDSTEILSTITYGENLGEDTRVLEVAVARGGEVIEIGDFEKVPSYPSPRNGTRSALLVPVRFEGQVVGVVGLYSRRPGGLGSNAREYAQAISAQATAAVTNARRYTEQQERSELLRMRADQLTQIFRLGRQFRTDQSVERNLSSVARAIRESVGFARVVVAVLTADRDAIVPTAHHGLQQGAFSLIEGEPIPWESMVGPLLKDEYRLSGSYLIPGSKSVPLAVALGFGAVSTNARAEDSTSISGEWQSGDLLIVPLYATNDDLLGILVTDKPMDGRVPTRNIIELMEIFGNQAAIIIENSRLYRSVEERAEELKSSLEDLERSYSELDKLSNEMIRKDAELSQANELLNLRAQRLLALHRIMESVDTTRDPHKVLDEITGAVVQEMDVDQCILLLEEDHGLRTIAAHGKVPTAEEIDGLLGAGDPITAAFEKNDTMLVVPGKPRSEATAALMRGIDAQTLVATPLHLEGYRRGVLAVGNTRPGAAFTEEDRDLFNLLCSQIGVEYENARLYQAVQTEAATAAADRDRLQQLHVTTTVLQQANTLEDRLAVIARGVKSVGWGRVLVALVDPELESVSHTATAGYNDPKDSARDRGRIEQLRIWETRFDEELSDARLGTSFYVRHDHPLVAQSQNGSDASQSTALSTGQTTPNGDWHPEDRLYMPMYTGTEMMGVIMLRDPATGDAPTEAALRPLELFVQQASSAIENTRLYQETADLQSYNEAVVQSIQQGIIVLSPELTIESVNDYIKRSFLWDDSYIGGSLFTWQPEFRTMGLTPGLLNSVLRSGRQVELPKLQVQRDENDQRTYNASAYARYDEDDMVTGIVLLLEDVTQRVRLEADIAKRGQQLAALSEVSRRITTNLNVPDVVASAITQAEEVFPYDRIAIWTQSFETENGMQLLGHAGYEENPPRRIELKQSDPLTQVMEQQLPALIADTHSDPHFQEGYPYRTWLAAPMISGGNIVGVIVFEQHEAHALAPADEQVAAAFGNQVGVALENARLFEEVTENASTLAQRTQRLALLNRISSTIGRSLDQTSILQTAVDEIARALEAPQGDVFMFEQEMGIARLTIQHPSRPDGSVEDVTLPIYENPAIDTLREYHKPFAVTDIENDPQMVAMAEAFTDRGIASTLLTPLIVGSTVIGFMAINTPEERPFQEEHLELAQTVTNQVAIAVQNAQLYGETVVRQRELRVLFEAGRIASESLDLATVTHNAAAYFNRALDADNSTIYLWKMDDDTLQPLTSVDRRGETIDGGSMLSLRDHPAIRTVVEEQGVVILAHEDAALSSAERSHLQGRGAASALLLPLVTRDDTIGLAELCAQDSGRKFTQSEIRLARTLASSIATAMENARLHDETQERLEELEIINQISRALTQTISTEDLFQILQAQFARVLDVDSLTVARHDLRTNQLVFPLAVRAGEQVEIEPHPFGQDLYSYVIQSRQPLIIRSDVTGFLEEQGLRLSNGATPQSFAAVPLQSGENIIGVMAIENYEDPYTFDDSDMRVLAPIAAQVAVSIENTRLYGELEQRLSETTILQEVSRIVNSALDLPEIFARVVNELADAFGYPVIGLFTLEETSLILQASYGYTGDRLDVVPVEEGIIGRVVRSGLGEFVPDVHSDPDYIQVQEWIQSLVAVPIISDEFVLGVLLVKSGMERPLGENDLQLLKTFAGQVATAMVNASLYAQMVELSEELERRVEERTLELREERDRIDTLFRITVELTASLDLDRVLNRALSLVGEAIGAEFGALFLIDPQSEMLIYRAAMSEYEIIPPGGRQIELKRHEGMAGWVMDNRRSIIVGNVQEDPRWANVPGTESRRSLLGAPLVANHQVLGCLFFSSDIRDAFNEGHLQLVEAAANQVATAINNAELYRLIRDQAERLGVMLRSQQTEAAKSQAILESIADGVMVSDSAGEIILFNAAAERILDLRRDEVLGRPSTDLMGIYGEGAQDWADMLERFNEQEPTEYDPENFVTTQIQLGQKYVQVSIAPVLHGDEYLGLVSVFRDITREVAADRAKSEFVANVSHELRTPMTSIKGYADLLLLQAAGEINEDQRRFLEVIKNNADRLTALVNDLLTISSIEQRDIELEVRNVALSEVVEDVLRTLAGRMQTDRKAVDIATEIPADLPPVEGDYDRITQIITNLVSNAYQYTENGGSIIIGAEQRGEGVLFSVTDTGIGIPFEQQSRIFERFYRGVEHPLVMASAGTGLGLSIVQHLVDMHSGRIEFESTPGVGTTFRVWLPFEFEYKAAFE